VSGLGDTSEVTVTWVRQSQKTYWIQEAGEVAAVVAPILQQALRDAKTSLIEQILEILKSDRLFHGPRSIVLHCSTQKNILGLALRSCSSEIVEGRGLAPITRLCLSQSQAAMSLIDDNFRTEIIESATYDLLWCMEQGQFDDSANYYQFLQKDAWKQLDQHGRLAVSSALRSNTSGFNGFESKKEEKWEKCDGWERRQVEDLDTYVHQRVALSIKLASQISTTFRKRPHGHYTVDVTGPFSLAVSCILLTSHVDKPSVNYCPWNTSVKNAPKAARAAVLVFQVLGEALESLDNCNKLVIMSTFKEKFLGPASILVGFLGPMAERVFESLLYDDELERIVIALAVKRNNDLVHLCKALSQFQRIASSPSLADTILKQEYELNYRSALTCVKVICDPSVAANGEENAAEVRWWANTV